MKHGTLVEIQLPRCGTVISIMFGPSPVVNILSCSFPSSCNTPTKSTRLARPPDYTSSEGAGEHHCRSGIHDENEEIPNKHMADMCKDLILHPSMPRAVPYLSGIMTDEDRIAFKGMRTKLIDEPHT